MHCAVLFSGFANFFNVGVPSFHKHLLQGHTFDVYAQTYDVVSSVFAKIKSRDTTPFNRVQPQFTQIVSPKSLLIESSHKSMEFQAEAARIKAIMTSDPSYPPVDRNHPGHGNLLSMEYGMGKAWELLEQALSSGAKYDCVIRARYDFVFEDSVNLSSFNLSRCTAPNVGKFHGCINDQFAVGNVDVMRQYFDVGNRVRDYILKDKISFDAERVLLHHLNKCGVGIDEVPIKYFLQRPFNRRFYMYADGSFKTI
jgi:hypothetical protein